MNALTIGHDTIFGEYVSIHDENHAQGEDGLHTQGFVTSPLVIGNNVWGGAKATILQGVHIGSNAVIGANAVVTRDIPADSVAVGIPAQVIKKNGP